MKECVSESGTVHDKGEGKQQKHKILFYGVEVTVSKINIQFLFSTHILATIYIFFQIGLAV